MTLIWIGMALMAGIGSTQSRQAVIQDRGRLVALLETRADPTPKLAAEPAQPLFLGYPHGPKDAQFVPKNARRETVTYDLGQNSKGHLYASPQAFAVESGEDPILGSVFGHPEDTRFNAVYDRQSDTLLTFKGGQIELSKAKEGFTFKTKGETTLELKRDYYKNHLGYFLWDNRDSLWKDPVAGWCSWMAHLQGVTEDDVRKASHFFAANLKEYGYDVIQIDDGFQRASQSGEPPLTPGTRFADLWSKPNDRFPSGLAQLAKEITRDGMTPGVWIGLFMPLGIQHKEGYITHSDGKPHKGPWVNYAVNGLEREALDEAYLQTIKDLKAQGWRYFKIDTLRHVLYDSYRVNPDYWTARKQSMEAAFRNVLGSIKKIAGPKDYVLACWGTMPELAGIADGARIGEDVSPDIPSMRRAAKYIAQFHYLNNVVWRNDPDYMCLRVPVEQARTWATLTSLAGGHVMVSDPIDAYDADRVEILRKVGPPLFTRPHAVQAHGPDPEFMTLAATKGAERWTVAARFAWSPQGVKSVPLKTLGLEAGKPYLAFDFWSSTFVGSVTDAVEFKALGEGSCQAISLRPDLGHPQILGTDRHLGQGAYELEGVKWESRTLSGKMKRGAGARWSLFVYIPDGWRLVSSKIPGADVISPEPHVLRVKFGEGSDAAEWSLKFEREE